MPPEPKKQATKGQKQIGKENQDTMVFYTGVVAAANIIYLLVTRIFFWSDFTFRYQVLFALTSGLYLAVMTVMKKMSGASTDLNTQSGLAEHLKDIILLMALVQMVGLLWNYAWLALLLIPARAFLLLWKNVLAPYFFAPAPPEVDEKKQRKMERRMRH